MKNYERCIVSMAMALTDAREAAEQIDYGDSRKQDKITSQKKQIEKLNETIRMKNETLSNMVGRASRTENKFQEYTNLINARDKQIEELKAVIVELTAQQ